MGGILNGSLLLYIFVRPFWKRTCTQPLSKFCRPSTIGTLQQCLNESHGPQSHKTYPEHKDPVKPSEQKARIDVSRITRGSAISLWLSLFVLSKSTKLLLEDIFMCLPLNVWQPNILIYLFLFKTGGWANNNNYECYASRGHLVHSLPPLIRLQIFRHEENARSAALHFCHTVLGKLSSYRALFWDWNNCLALMQT